MVKKHLNEHIICYNFSNFIEKRFYLSSLLHNLNAFEFIFILNHVFSKEPQWLFFSEGLLARLISANKLHYVVFLSFFYIQQFPKFFMVQVFHSPGFSEPIDFSGSRSFSVKSMFFWVRVHGLGLGPDFRSGQIILLIYLKTFPLAGSILT